MNTYVAVFAMVMAYVAVVASYCALRTLARLRRATAVLARGADTRESIIEATERHIELTTAVAGQLGELRGELAAVQSSAAEVVAAGQARLDEQMAALRTSGAGSLRNVALVRFDAFDDMAGRMSFALALMDDFGDGVALTAIAGRSDTRVYAKGVRGGNGEQELSPEERAAVSAARKQAAVHGAVRGRAAEHPDRAVEASFEAEPEREAGAA